MTISYDHGNSEEDRRRTELSSHLRYGLSNRHFNADVVYDRFYDPYHNGSFKISGGKNVFQFNEKDPISEFINSLYSLWGEKNYMKIYEKEFLNVYHRRELVNGLTLVTTTEYSKRLPLVNTSTYKFTNVEGREFESNVPGNPALGGNSFAVHQALTLDVLVSYRPGMEYASRPEGKYNLGTKYPVLRAYYTKGFHVLGSDVDFDKFRFTVSDEMDLGLFGKLSYLAGYGDFLNSSKVYFQDYRHFSGNKTWFSKFRLDDLRSLDYYVFSTTHSYVEAHGEYNMGGFLLNKIPLIRKLKFREIVTVHYLNTNELKQFVELTAGVEKLNLLRMEFVTSIADGRRAAIGVVFGLKYTFGL
jgi:hypothetical protein